VKRVYSAQNTLMVDHLKHVLDAESIDCVVRNRFASGAAGRLPPTECWTELWILDDAQFAQAHALVEQAFEQDDGAGGGAWECPRCGEQLEPQFEACWKCCTLRGAAAEEASYGEQAAQRAPARLRTGMSVEMRLWLVLGLMAFTAWYVFRSYAG
jgi:hypothetical protein